MGAGRRERLQPKHGRRSIHLLVRLLYPLSFLALVPPPFFLVLKKRLDDEHPLLSFSLVFASPPLAASPTFDMTLVAPDHGPNASGDSSSYRALVRGHLPLEKTTPPTQQHALHATGPDNVTWDTIPAPDFARQQYTGSNASHLRGLEIVPSSVRAAHGSAGSMHQPHFAAHLEYPVDPQL